MYEENANKVIQVAKDQVGYLEKKDGNLKFLYDKTANAGYNNYTKYGYEMHALSPATMDYPAPWCDAFVDWCFYTAYGEEVAKELLGGAFDDYTPMSARLYKEMGCWHTENPKAGDQIFFTNGERINHTGIVIAAGTQTVTTIEGNTSASQEVVANGGGVYKKSYSVHNPRIAGYGRPPYSRYEDKTELIRAGQIHSINFTGHQIATDGIRGPETRQQAVRVLQTALNLDYNSKLEVDGDLGPKTIVALDSHYVAKGETQYMVTAAEILLYMLGKNPNGVECPGHFGSGLEAAAGTNRISSTMFIGFTN